MTTNIQGPGMIQRGEVRQVRELKRGVQAQVCLGSSSRHGSAIVTVETDSPEVMRALATLKAALARDALKLMADITEDDLASTA